MIKQVKPISTLNELKRTYKEEQNQHPLLLVDLAGGNENLHTNVLGAVLYFRGYMFLESFLERVAPIGVSGEVEDISITTQKKALGLKGKKPGFIDLYIECTDAGTGNRHKIVIENKINGAGDTEKQMLRYIASIKKDPIKKDAFSNWEREIRSKNNSALSILKEDCDNCHFVYLTLDGSDPGEDSLPSVLYDNNNPIINYYKINYPDDILPWLKEVVLEGCPYSDNGITIAGLQQYIASLERLVQSNVPVSSVVQDYVNGIKESGNSDSKTYNRLLDEMKILRETEAQDNVSLWRELKQAAENIYSDGAVDSQWILHFTPSILLLYKQEWMTIGKGSYSIPFVNLCASNKISPEKEPSLPITISWEIHIEHYSLTGERPNTLIKKYVNHDKTACIPLPETNSVELGDRENAEERRKYFSNIIKIAERQIAGIDDSFKEVRKDEEVRKDDKMIGKALLQKIANRLCSDTKS